MSVRAFLAIECAGMARVDFFLRGDDELWLNEINTIPGFTSISMYPKLWDASGLPYAELVERASSFGLDLRLGFELTPALPLLDDDLERYRLGDLPAVLMELPFHGSLRLAEALGERIQGSGLVPVIAHPERSEVVVGDPGLAAGLRERGWLLQMNATSVLGFHGAAIELTAWGLLEEGLVDLFGSDGHRTARPATLDDAYRLVEARMGEGARRLFDGSVLAGLAAGDGVDLAQGR